MPITDELRQAFDLEETAIELFEANREVDRLLDIVYRVGRANQLCDPDRYSRTQALVREALEE